MGNFLDHADTYAWPDKKGRALRYGGVIDYWTGPQVDPNGKPVCDLSDPTDHIVSEIIDAAIEKLMKRVGYTDEQPKQMIKNKGGK